MSINIYYSNQDNGYYISPLDIIFFYDDAFRYTMYFFNNNKKSCYYKFIRKLFTFGKYSVQMYFTTNIIGYFIIKNQLYELIDLINTIGLNIIQQKPTINSKNGLVFELIDCCKSTMSFILNENIKKFFDEKCYEIDNINCNENKTKLPDLYSMIGKETYKYILYEVIKYIENIKDYNLFNIDNYIIYWNTHNSAINKGDIKTKTDIKYDIILRLTEFIYLYYCIDQNYSKHILNYYILNFIKSDNKVKYNINFEKIKYKEYNNIQNSLFEKFTLSNKEFKILEYKPGFTSKYGSFSTCGETTILNILNYFLIDDKGIFNIGKIKKGSDDLKKFYIKYPNITLQFENQNQTMLDWLDVVSNLPNKNIYNKFSNDIHNNIKNIEYVFKTILNTNKTFIDILHELNKDKIKLKEDEYEDDSENIKILYSDENSLVLNLNNEFKVSFEPGHGQFLNLEKIDIYEKSFDEKINDLYYNHDLSDFEFMYTFYSIINFNHDISEQYSYIILSVFIKDKKELPKYQIIYDLLGTFESFIFDYITYDDYIKYIKYFNNLKYVIFRFINDIGNSFNYLKNIENLDISFIEKPKPILFNLKKLKRLYLHNYNQSINNSFEELRSLKYLTLFGFNYIIDNSFDNLINLEKLQLYDYDNPINQSFNKLKNLKSLLLRDYKQYELKNSLNSLTELTNLFLIKYNKFIGESFNSLKKLEILYLDYYNIDIGKSFDNLTNLKQLYLLCYDKPIENSFNNLKNLEKLYLKNYNIDIGNSFDNLLNLKQLYLIHYNKPIEKSFNNLKNLEELYMNNFNLSIDDSFNNLINLKKLTLVEYNQHINNSFNNLKKLEYLDLFTYNKLIDNSFVKLENLETLVLYNYNNLIGKSLNNLKKLETVYVAVNFPDIQNIQLKNIDITNITPFDNYDYQKYEIFPYE